MTKKSNAPAALVDTPPAKRDLGWGWACGWSLHPRDIAHAAKLNPAAYPPSMRKILAAAWRRKLARIKAEQASTILAIGSRPGARMKPGAARLWRKVEKLSKRRTAARKSTPKIK